MTLNRAAAMDYAERFWNRPCDDGLILTSSGEVSISRKRILLNAPALGWDAVFVPYSDAGGIAEMAVFRDKNGVQPDKTIQLWEGLLDCAHYLSKCLQKEGINVSEVGVAKLVAALQRRRDGKTLVEKVTKDQGQRVVDSGILKKGDMIGYFNVNEHDYGYLHYGHSAMYVGKDHDPSGGITCHTVCRLSGVTFPGTRGLHFPDSWFLHDGFLYTFIHFSDDDPPLTGTMVNSLMGWWKLEYGGTTAYWRVAADGTARYSSSPPRTSFERPRPGGDSAYYFRDGNRITFIWRKTGDVAVWIPVGDRAQFNITVNGIAGRSTRVLFSPHGGRH